MPNIEQGSLNAQSALATELNQQIIISLLDNYSIRVAEDSVTPTYTYVGKAATGSATSSAVWQIARLDETSGTIQVLLYADGDDLFNNVWDNRESLSYS